MKTKAISSKMYTYEEYPYQKLGKILGGKWREKLSDDPAWMDDATFHANLNSLNYLTIFVINSLE